MAFESLHEIAKNSRNSRGSITPKALVSVTQAYYADKNSRIITIRLTADALSQARMQVSDRVDIAYDPDSNLWRVALIQDLKTKKGYAISGSSQSKHGQIRFTHYQGMPLISEENTRKARAFSEDEKVAFSPGQIIFSLAEIKTHEKSVNEELFTMET
jgi:hypothetical protein